MRAFVQSLVVLLAVPLLTGLVALGGRAQWDDRWQAGLRRGAQLRHQQLDPRLAQRYSLNALCSDARAAATLPPCRTYNRFSTLVSASVVTGGLGLLLLAGIAAAGVACRARRTRLSALFPAGAYLALGGLALLTLLHGALALAGLYLLGEVIERWPPMIVFAAAVCALVLVLAIVQEVVWLTRPVATSVVGWAVEPGTQPRLLAVVSAIASALGVSLPDRIVLGLTPGFFVTEAKVVCLAGPLSGRILYLSLPLLRILSVDELRGVLAHELAHFRGPDEGLSRRFYPFHAGLVRQAQALRRQARGMRSVVVLPALAVLSFFLESFAAAEAAAERERERAADDVAAAVSGPAHFAAALAKVHAFTPAWDAAFAAMDRAVHAGEQYQNASRLFAEIATANAGPERLRGLGNRSLLHPTDAHPPLARRLAALSVGGDEIAAAALETRPAHPAVVLVDGCDEMEESLSRVEHRLLALDRALE